MTGLILTIFGFAVGFCALYLLWKQHKKQELEENSILFDPEFDPLAIISKLRTEQAELQRELSRNRDKGVRANNSQVAISGYDGIPYWGVATGEMGFRQAGYEPQTTQLPEIDKPKFSRIDPEYSYSEEPAFWTARRVADPERSVIIDFPTPSEKTIISVSQTPSHTYSTDDPLSYQEFI
jgi:hypothetical protein